LNAQQNVREIEISKLYRSGLELAVDKLYNLDDDSHVPSTCFVSAYCTGSEDLKPLVTMP